MSGAEQNENFNHRNLFPNTSTSAHKILRLLFELMEIPSSVLDVGGGIGAWSKVFLELGVNQVTCIDDPRVLIGDLMIPRQCFMPWDLSRSFPEPTRVDLAVCLEVAEHLPPENALGLINFLTSCAPIVLFSASIPGQPGYHHINEKPTIYWKRLFGDQGYDQYDIIRPRIIIDGELPYWYRQNIFVYVSQEGTLKVRDRKVSFSMIPDDFELVHERILNIYRRTSEPLGLGGLLRQLPQALKKTINKRLVGLTKPGF